MAITRAQGFWSEKCTLGISWRSLCKALPELLLCLLGQSSRHWSCCWSDALSQPCAAQHIIVGLLLFLYASEKNRSVTPRMCTMLMEMELCTLTEFQVQSFITSSDKDTDNKGLLCSQQLSPLVLLWPCWDFHLHQSWFRTSLWWLIAPLIFNKVYWICEGDCRAQMHVL